MPKTPNLGLNLTTDLNTTIGDWQPTIDGQSDTNPSNMQIIDEFAGQAGRAVSQFMSGDIPAGSIDYLTTPPTEDNPHGIKLVLLSSPPETKYNGYIYIITTEN